jgi:hypothetical protein
MAMTSAYVPYAVGGLRDQFLLALDNGDVALSHRLAQQLLGCHNALPGMACDQLGLPRHSTYSCAARVVLDTSRPFGATVRVVD